LDYLQRRGNRTGRRRAEPPNGLMLMPPPRTALTLLGFDPRLGMAGAGPGRIVAASRESALMLRADDEGHVHGVSRMIRRTWSLPDLLLLGEERPEQDPARDLPGAVFLDDLADGDLPASAVVAPGGAVVAVPVFETARVYSLAILRTEDRALCRVIRWARCGAWAPDGQLLVIGGEWGLLALARVGDSPGA
jgi:hypothetical protein